jgi:transposase
MVSHRQNDSGDIMGRAIEIVTELSAEELRAAARTEDDRRAALRMLAIANELDGCERTEAARLAGMSDQALRDAIKRLNAEGIDGLYDRPRSGRPRRLSAKQEAEVKAAVLAGPDIEKDGLCAFTLNDILLLIAERYGVRYHVNRGRADAPLGVVATEGATEPSEEGRGRRSGLQKGRQRAERDCSYTPAAR